MGKSPKLKVKYFRDKKTFYTVPKKYKDHKNQFDISGIAYSKYGKKNVNLYYNDYFRGTKTELRDVIFSLVTECCDDDDDGESEVVYSALKYLSSIKKECPLDCDFIVIMND